MTLMEFGDKILNDYKLVIGPQFRGDKYPNFDKLKINESKFADNCRFKSWDIEEMDIGDYFISWTTQGSFNRIEALTFKKEVARCFKELKKYFDIKDKIRITIKMISRSGSKYGYAIYKFKI